MTTLKLKDYPILIGATNKHELTSIIDRGQYSKIVVLVDHNTRQHCLPLFSSLIGQEYPIIEITPGELHKNLETCSMIWEAMMDHEMDRHSLLINLGGGVIGDMGGFCASTYLRGIDFIQIPTTLLSQVDASIGGKLGVDFNLLKNSVGLFNNPQAVIVDPAYLKTLSKQEVRSGFAEVFKHALIADKHLWDDLKKHTDLSNIDWSPILARSLKIKQTIVEVDPFEKGLRKALNFGHTIGHAVETFSLKTNHPLLHGEAIALGMVCESWLSNQMGSLTDQELQDITTFIKAIYPPYHLEESSFPTILQYMKKDKKNRDGAINFTYLSSIGTAKINQTADTDLICASMRYYLAKA